MPVNLRVLGPLEVDVGGRVEHLAARKTRTLLAMLALHANRPVDVDRLVDAVWPVEPPRTAAKTLQTYVLHLRRVLGDGAIVTSASGYRLSIDPVLLDVAEFERLAADGRRSMDGAAPATASARFRDALTLWRGPPYPDLVDVASAAGELARLVDLHAQTIEDAVDADLALGQHRVLIGRLEALTVEHPLRERLWQQLMLALYRSGRQAEALRAYQTARSVLADELGIDPGPELKRLERAVLLQDPALGISTGPLGPAAAEVPTTRYARNGSIHLAYQIFGDAGPTILVVPDWYSHVEALWEHPAPVRLLQGLGRFARIILFDARGTGMSDPVDLDDRPTLEQWADDALAVLDEVGVDRAYVLGASAGSSVAVLLAAARPERVQGLVLYNAVTSFAALAPASLGLDALVELFRARWGEQPALENVAPGLTDDPSMLAWFGRYQRLSGSPGRIATRVQMVASIDVRGIASTVRTRALVIHRTGNRICRPEDAESLATSMISGRYVPIAGDEHLWMVGDFDELLAHVEEFVLVEEVGSPSDRALGTVLAVELVDPDAAPAARFTTSVLRHVDRFRGATHDVGTGVVLCSFTGPTSAIRCAHAAFVAARQLGLDVKAGAHTGEIERDAGHLGGGTSRIARALAARADRGELLVTRRVVDLASGAGTAFIDRGVVTLEGELGDWPVHAVLS